MVLTYRNPIPLIAVAFCFTISCGKGELHVRNDLGWPIVGICIQPLDSDVEEWIWMLALESGQEASIELDCGSYELKAMGFFGDYFVQNVNLESEGYSWSITWDNHVDEQWTDN